MFLSLVIFHRHAFGILPHRSATHYCPQGLSRTFMSSRPTNLDNGSNMGSDQWSSQASLYSSQAARITELHGSDLVTLLKDDILQARTILDVGCGTGAFAQAYRQQFPTGIPGQTLILSDLSAGMLQKAKETIQIDDNTFHTKIIFQQEDGTKLEGIADSSIDIVVSMFGVFLIPDQEATRRAIQRVLKKPQGIVAIASWQFNVTDGLTYPQFGVSLQDAFEVAVRTIDPVTPSTSGSIKQWATRDGASQILTNDYRMEHVEIYSALHSTVWEFDNLWNVMCTNPMSNIQAAAPEDAARAKDALIKFVSQDGKHSIGKPLMLFTASNLCLGRVFAS